jgi:hypothetical protein
MIDRFILGIGALCSAAGIGCASFAIGHDITSSESFADGKNVGIGLLLSIAVAVWGSFALQLWKKSGKE